MINFQLKENEIKPLQQAMDTEMQKALKHFEGELLKIRSGRAHTSLVEDIQVSCYGGAPMALKGLAALTAPESDMIVIQPWDTSILADIERAISNSDIGVTPLNDGNILRIRLPKMSSERRDELLKVLGKKLEECRIAIRNIRKEFNNFIRDAQKSKTISENFFNRLEDVVQDATDAMIKKAEQAAQKKEADLTSL